MYESAKRQLRFESFAHWEAIKEYTTEDYDALRLSMCKKNRFRKSNAINRTRSLMDQLAGAHATLYDDTNSIWDEDEFFDYKDRVHPLTDAEAAMQEITGRRKTVQQPTKAEVTKPCTPSRRTQTKTLLTIEQHQAKFQETKQRAKHFGSLFSSMLDNPEKWHPDHKKQEEEEVPSIPIRVRKRS